MKKPMLNANRPNQVADTETKANPPGYPLYPESEDIYNQSVEAVDVDPENPALLKTTNLREESGADNEEDFEDDFSGSDLDIPGAELDDAQEAIGNEDEENNFYSIGGDNHNNLEEDQGDTI